MLKEKYFCFAELARKISPRLIMHCRGERLRKGTAMFCVLRCAWLFLPWESVGAIHPWWWQSGGFACTLPWGKCGGVTLSKWEVRSV